MGIIASRRGLICIQMGLLIAVLILMLVAMTSCRTETPSTSATTIPAVTTTLSINPFPKTNSPTPSVNSNLVFATIGDQRIFQGAPFTYILYATSTSGNPLSYFAFNLPSGAVFNSSTHTFSWTPPSTGDYPNISFAVSDGKDKMTQNIKITVLQYMPSYLEPISPEIIPLSIIYYGAHNPSIDSRIIKASPQYTIINSANGPWGKISRRDILSDIDEYKSAKIKVIGYITSGYEAKGSAGTLDAKMYTLEANLQFIKDMALIDHVDGVFIDECNDFPDQADKTYLKTLTDLVHSYGLIAWGNVGVAIFDSWYFTAGGFDLMQSNEDWQGQALSQVQKDWGYRISVSGSDPNYTAQDAFRITLAARNQGLAYCYISNTGYETLPSWLEEYSVLQNTYKLPIGK